MTLVSIVGDFYSSVLPIFYEFSDRMTNHIIVYDEDRFDVQHARKIVKGTKRFIQKHNLPIQTYTKAINEDYEKSIEDVLLLALDIAQDPSEIFINATDGLANVALLLAVRHFDKGVRFIAYDRFDNEYNCLSKLGMSTKKLEKKIDIATHFLLKDIDIIEMGDQNEALRLKEELALFFQEYRGDAERFVRENPKCDKAFKTMANPGFLFEKYVYTLLCDLGHDDIAYGVKIEDEHSKTRGYRNEFDLLILKDHHLHIIECKYKRFTNSKSTQEKTDILYKLDSIRDIVDDDSRVLLLTNEARYNYMDTSAATTVKRARASNIFIRGSIEGREEVFRNDIKNIFKLGRI